MPHFHSAAGIPAHLPGFPLRQSKKIKRCACGSDQKGNNMKLYEIIEGLSESGYFKIKTDLKTKTIRIANTTIISEGKVENHTFTADDIEYTFTGLTDERDLCELYRQYKYSIPGARDGRFRSYFKALPVDKLTDEEMVEAIDRHEAKVKLEAYILLASRTLVRHCLPPPCF